MTRTIRLSIAALAACAGFAPPTLADVSIGSCYIRADVGYGWSDVDASASTNPFNTTIASGPVNEADLDDAWFGDIGFGCGLDRTTITGA